MTRHKSPRRHVPRRFRRKTVKPVATRRKPATLASMSSKGGIKHLGALRIVNPDKWSAKVRGAMERNGRDVAKAANELGISLRHMWRFLEDESFSDITEEFSHGNRTGTGVADRAAALIEFAKFEADVKDKSRAGVASYVAGVLNWEGFRTPAGQIYTGPRVLALVEKPPPTRRGISEMGALRRVNERSWAKQIRDTMEKHDGRVPAAAEELKITPRQLWRWLADPLLSDVYKARTGNPHGEV